MRALLGIFAVVVAALVGLVIWVYSGSLEVSAREPLAPAMEWLRTTLTRQSVRAHAAGIQVPPLGDSVLVEEGAHNYARNCAFCHGAPGVEPEPFARALRPAPPDLAQAVRGWTSAELFWITQNGLMMSAMPAWQGVHVEGELWGLVAFMDQMPNMDAARYQALTAPPAPPPEPTPEAQPEMAPEAQPETAPSPEVIPPQEEGEPAPRP